MIQDEKEIRIGRSFYLLAMSFVLPIAVGFGYYLLAPPRYFYPPLLAGIAILAFVCAIYAFYRWSLDETMFILSVEGITDHIHGYGTIPWNEIMHAAVRQSSFRTGNICTLVLYVRDPDKYRRVREAKGMRERYVTHSMGGDIHLDIREADLRPRQFLDEVTRRIPTANKQEFISDGTDPNVPGWSSL